MLPPTTGYQALRDLAALLSRDAPTDDLVPSALDYVRRAARLDKLALAWSRGDNVSGNGLFRCWLSSKRDSSAARAKAVKAAKAVFSMRSIPDCPIEIPFGRTRLHAIPLAVNRGASAILLAGGRGAMDGWLEFLQAAGAQIALMLEREEYARRFAEAREDARKRIAEISTIYEIGEAIQSFAVKDVLRVIPEKAAAVMGAQACSLMLLEPEGRHLVIVADYGLSEEIVSGTRIALGEGIAGRVAQTGEPMLIHDLRRDPRFADADMSAREWIGSSMCVPLRDSSGEIQGVLSIRRHVPAEQFTQDDLKLFRIFANQAALAISNAQLYSRLNRRVQELSNISDLTRTITSTLALDQVLQRIADSITGVVGFDRCCVYLLDPRTEEFVATIVRGFEPGQDLPTTVKKSEGAVGLAAHEKIPIFTQDPLDSKSGHGSKVSVAAPIVVKGSSIGVVVVDNQISLRQIPPVAVELLSTFVSQAGIAIENARLYEAMEQKYAELNVLYEQSKSIGSAYGLDNAAQMLLDAASKGVECDSGLIVLFDNRGQSLGLKVCAGLSEKGSSLVSERIKSEAAADFVRSLRDPILLPLEGRGRLSEEQHRLLNDLLPDGHSAILIPLVAEDTTVGALALLRESGARFSANDLQLLSIMVSHAAVVIKNAIAYEDRMRQSELELSVLYEFSKRISSAPSLEDALDSILAIVGEIVPCDESAIYAVDQEHDLVVAKAARLGHAQAVEVKSLPMDSDNVICWAIHARKAIVSPDISKDSRFTHVGLGEDAVRSLMAIPLMVHDDVVGVLGVFSYHANRYSEDDVRVLSIIASQGAAIYRELEALTALTSYTNNILSSIAAGVVTLDSDGTILTWNRAAKSIVGVESEKVSGWHYSRLISKLALTQSDKGKLTEIIEQVLQTGQTYQGHKLCFEPTYGGRVYINMSVSQLTDNAGEQRGLVCIFEDVTKEIKAEDDLRRMGELAAVGQLAASIAHELRNPLSSIKGAAQFLQEQYSDHSDVHEFLSIIVEEVNGLNKLTTEFLEFARPIDLESEPLDLREVVDRTLHLMSVLISGSGIDVVQEVGPDLPIIQADEKQIEQVLKNVILNAVEAMPDGGTLHVRARCSAAYGESVELGVSDTGVGIPPDKLENIFLPFVTTKTKGTGLGLSVVQKIVENHGGHIEVQSTVGEGTTFRVFLPRERGIRTPEEAA